MNRSLHRRIGTGLLTLTLAALFSAAPARAAEVSPYLPNDSQIVWKLNVQQVLDSELVKKYALEHIKKALKENSEAATILQQLGFNPLQDVTSVTGAAASIDDAKDKSVVVIQGKFDVAKFESLAAAKAQETKDHLKVHTVGTYKVYEVISKEKDKDTFFVGLIDANNMVAAPSKELVVDAFDKKANKKKAAVNKELVDLLSQTESRRSLSLVALGASLTKAAANNPTTKVFADKLKSVTGGITVGDDVKIEFVFHAKDAEGAKLMTKSLNDGVAQAKGLVGLFAAQEPKIAPLIDILNTLKVTPKENDVTLSGEISKDLIEKAAKNINN